MSNFQDFARFLQMDDEERKEHVTDLLANVAEVWMDDGTDSIMVRGMISSMRAFFDSVDELMEAKKNGAKQPNQYVAGLFQHAYTQQVRNYAALTGLTDVKRTFQNKDDD